MHYNCNDLILIFNKLFQQSQQTILIGGSEEPIYLPKDKQCDFNRIVYREDFYSSALHEIAHWCIAGKKRREQVDFGYWYKPDGRNVQEQELFESVEIKPQAIEWIFSTSAGVTFNISQDNLSGEHSNSDYFKQNVYQQMMDYLTFGLPADAEKFKTALLEFYGQ